jgi:hypothetical protein
LCALAFLQRVTSDEPRQMEVAAAFKGHCSAGPSG